MSVLVDHEIRALCDDGMIDPYDPEAVQPASYDVKLAHEFRVFTDHEVEAVDMANVQDATTLVRRTPEQGFILHPGEFVLARTVEKLWMPNNIVGRVEGKSSVGRLGLIVHATAGYIDPGFHGPITLEMTNLRRVPIKLRPGLPIGQFSFQRCSAEPDKPYEGRYQGDESVSASRYGQPSTLWPSRASGRPALGTLVVVSMPSSQYDGREGIYGGLGIAGGCHLIKLAECTIQAAEGEFRVKT